jgi:DNA-binding MarR family transcriptional regulator
LSRQVLSAQQSAALAAWVRLLRGHGAARRLLTVQLQSEHGLTVNDYEALLALSHADDKMLRRVDLAERLQLTPSGVTRLLDGLESCDLVEKATCSSDARVTYAVLTDAGHERLRQASRSHLASVQALFEERFTETELETLAELLGRLPGAGAADPSECEAG